MKNFKVFSAAIAIALSTTAISHAAQIGFGQLTFNGITSFIPGMPDDIAIVNASATYALALPDAAATADYTVTGLLQIGNNVVVNTASVFANSTIDDVLADPLVGQLAFAISQIATVPSGGFAFAGLTFGYDANFIATDLISGTGTLSAFVSDPGTGLLASLFGNQAVTNTPFSLTLSFDAQDSVSTVPVPASFLLLAGGLGGMCLFRRRSKQS